MELVIKIGGIGFFITILGSLLSASGKSDWVSYINLAGVVFVMSIILSEIYKLFNVMQTMFNL